MPRAKCFVKLVLHKVAGQNPHHKNLPHAKALEVKVLGEIE